MGRFKGDTPPKKLARLETWFAVEADMGKTRFRQSKFLVLLGHEAGDVLVALGLRAKAENISGADYNFEAFTSARLRFPSIHTHYGDVLNVVEKTDDFDFIFLDFCQQLTESMMDTVALSAISGLRKDAVSYLACGFLAGREQDTKGGLRKRVLYESARLDKRLRELPKEKREEWQESKPYLARAAIFQFELLRRIRDSGCIAAPLSLFFYRSRGAGEPKGLPMCIYLCRIVWCSRHSVEAEARAALEEVPTYHFFNQTDKELGLQAVKLAEQGYDPSYLLNVSRTTVAAWKAHASRGTYKP